MSTTPFNAADYLDRPETIAEYLSEALESEDWTAIVKAIETVANARGMSWIVEDAGLWSDSWNHATESDTEPGFATVLKVLHTLGVSLVAQPRAA